MGRDRRLIVRASGAGLCVCVVALAAPVLAQTVSHRGFIEGLAFTFPQTTPDDQAHVVADLLAREEVTVRPARWVLFAGGVDLRANSHDQVEDSWRVDYSDRGLRRPRLSVRRLMATVTRGSLTVDAGKQFIRWGKTDIVVPTDRFAPRDYLTVVESPFLAVTALRGTLQMGNHTIDGVWAPRFTPSRIPLLGQRWAVIPPAFPPSVTVMEQAVPLPSRSQAGVRWGQTASALEYSVSFFDGFNHAPDIRLGNLDLAAGRVDFARVFPPIRMYGGDAAIPARWFTVKGEAAYFTSSSATTDEYVLYVVQLERQTGEWVFVGGYAGEKVTRNRAALSFAPDRGLSRSILARAAYTIDPNRSFEVEGAVRQNGDGIYLKGEYSQSRGQHWRTTIAGVAIGGDLDDFLGQYRRNSHLRLTVRFSF